MPFQNGVPEHEIPPLVANGPKSSTWIVSSTDAGAGQRSALSVSWAPGRTFASLTCVVTCGAAATTVVSAASRHGVSVARTNSLATRLSR